MMRITGTVELSDLCAELGIASIPGTDAERTRVEVEVDGDDAWDRLRSDGYGSRLVHEDDAIEAPDPQLLQDWIAVLLSGDARLARLLAPRVFTDVGTLEACERALTAVACNRRAA